MDSLADRLTPAALVSGVVLAALAVGAYVVLVRRRRARGWSRSWASRSAVADVGMVAGTIPWVWMIMTPTGGPGAVRLVPFQDLGGVLAGGDALVQVVGNLLVFAALGFFLPIRYRLARPASVIVVVSLVAATLSTVLEILQWVLALGRVSSVDDVVVNTAGAALAALLSMHWWRARRSDGSAATGQSV